MKRRKVYWRTRQAGRRAASCGTPLQVLDNDRLFEEVRLLADVVAAQRRLLDEFSAAWAAERAWRQAAELRAGPRDDGGVFPGEVT
jgi:hypothetical protein